MKLKEKFLSLLLITCLFVVYSGCRTKSKMQKSSSYTDKSHYVKADSAVIALNQKLEVKTVDTSKHVNEETTIKTTKRTIDVFLGLDSAHVLLADSLGNVSLLDMINSGLARSRDLRIRIQEEINERATKKAITNQGKSETQTAETNLLASNGSKYEAKKNVSAKSKEEHKLKKPAIPAGNFGSWFIITLVLICLGLVLYSKFKS